MNEGSKQPTIEEKYKKGTGRLFHWLGIPIVILFNSWILVLSIGWIFLPLKSSLIIAWIIFVLNCLLVFWYYGINNTLKKIKKDLLAKRDKDIPNS